MSCTLQHISIDMNGDKPIKFGGTLFDIADLSALPTAFTETFTAAIATTSGALNGPTKECATVKRFTAQILLTAKGAGFASCAFKLQQSNVGGSAAAVWTDVSGATLTLTDVGGGFLGLTTEGLKLARFLRLVATATGGTATYYAILHGINK